MKVKYFLINILMLFVINEAFASSSSRFLIAPLSVSFDDSLVGNCQLGYDNICHWSSSTITWKYNADECYESEGDAVAALEAAFAKWDSVSTASLTFTKSTPKVAYQVPSDDGETSLVFIFSLRI